MMTDMIQIQSVQDTQLQRVLFDNAQKMDADQDYWFKLRGDNSNPLIDAATPMLGMALRVQSLAQCDHVEKMYKQAVEEIRSIEVELFGADYDRAVILAYRYILCSFIDEAVMGTPWGAESVWAQHSLLTRFHNETWGGEKFFTILSRLEGEPEKYKEILEFIFLCLNLGFHGRYRVLDNGREEYERVVVNLYQTLKRLREQDDIPEPELAKDTNKVVSKKYRLSRQVPVWAVFMFFFGTCSLVFFAYFLALNNVSMEVVEQLNQILQ
jgi:type VI secretion system protein ImpK